MAYINITGDSDGDLHTASLHNTKFGAIASVLNGNVDHDNLKYPRSVSTMNFSANQTATGWFVPQDSSAGTTTQAAVLGYQIYGVVSLSSNNVTNVMKSSLIRMPSAATLTSVKFLYLPRSTGYAAGDECDLYLQRSTSLTSDFENIASLENVSFYNASNVIMREYTLAISGAAIAAGQYIRFAIRTDPLNGELPPYISSLTLNFATATVA
tara:strand:+ start:2844 stop:3476 length:633 start_codon:yes stop_codon:yes gene_type:complete